MQGPDAPRPDELGSDEPTAPGDEQIEAARAAAREARGEMDRAQNDAEGRADELAARAQKARKSLDKGLQPGKNSIVGDRETSRGLGVGLTIAYGIIGAPIAGWLIGLGIDKAVGHQTGIGSWLVVAGAVGGIVFAIVTLNRQNS